MLEWFKVSARVRYDRRLERLEGEAFRTYLYLCCVASEMRPRWILTSDDLREFVGEFGLNGFDVVTVINAVRDLGLVEDIADGWRFVQAEGWQQQCGHPSDDAEAALARQRRHRAKLPGYCAHGLSVTTCHECHDKRIEESREEPPCSPPPGGDGAGLAGKRARTPKAAPRKAGEEAYSAEFEAFWQAYPRHVKKFRAWECWETLLELGYVPSDLIKAAEHYAEECQLLGASVGVRLHPSTFLSKSGRPFLEYVAGVPDATAARRSSPVARRNEGRAQLVGGAGISEEEAMAAVGGRG
ncbi:MAG: hypothetical protein ACYC6A_00700 [Armatimonadota bacterium]